MTKFKKEMDYAQKLYQSNTPRTGSERTDTFQKSMVVLWKTMSTLFHPQWNKNNGPVGERVFVDWYSELERFGSDGVLRGITAVKNSGSSYMPALNKFIGYCMENQSSAPSSDFGNWETCPYTGRRRRVKPGQELLAARLESDGRTHDEIRVGIEAYIAAGQPEAWTINQPQGS